MTAPRRPRNHPLTHGALRLGAATLGLALGLLTAAPARALEPSPRKQCALCHVAWTTSLDEASDLLPAWLGPSPSARDTGGGASAEQVCYSCHDGYVVDSREQGFTGHNHPVGIRPLEAMPKSPKDLPVTSTGEIYCGTCHTAHSESTSERVDFSFFLRMRNDRSELCRRCHVRQSGGGPSHPVDVPVKDGLPEIFRRLGARVGKTDGAVLCETCHRVHGSPNPDGLRLAVDSAELCSKCHPGRAAAAEEPDQSRVLAHRLGVRTPLGSVPAEVRDRGSRLDARGGLTCLTCHSVHRSGSRQHLLLEDNTDSAFCLRCHPNNKKVVGTPHDFARSAPRLQNRFGESAASGAGACGVCHKAHGWAMPLGKGRNSVAVCAGCHGPEGQARTKLGVAYSHSVDRPLEAAARSAKLPVFDDWVHAAPNGKMACSSCHDSHGEKQAPEQGSGVIPEFLRRPEEVLCVACHPEHGSVVGTAHDLRRSAPTVRNVKGRTAAEAGACGSCHLVHDGRPPFGFAWTQPAGATNEAASGDACRAECLGCHSPDQHGPGKPAGGPDDHPMGSGVLLAPPRSLPPAGLGGRARQDRFLTCCTCHEPHARAEKGSLLRQRVAGDSTLCLTCHPDAASMVGSAHDLAARGSQALNVDGVTAAAGGPCSACHVSHGGKGKLLWAVPARPTTGHDAPAETCLGCHGPGGGAPTPARLAHPEWPLVTTAALPLPSGDRHGRGVPVLALPGGGTGGQGAITCRTCHAAHPPGVDAAGQPVPRSTVSPLLNRADVMGPLCGSCHGLESLNLFLRFHDPKVKAKALGARVPAGGANGAR